MKDLIDYILAGILKDQTYEVEESKEGDREIFVVKVPKDVFGLVIGKGGNTIRSIRSLLRVRATLDKTLFDLQVVEK